MGKEGKEPKEKKDKGKDKEEKGKRQKVQEDVKEKTARKIAALQRKLATLQQTLTAEQGGAAPNKTLATIAGVELRCDKDVRITVGPVIGKVTSTTAVVLLEVTLSAEVTVRFVPEGSTDPAQIRSAKLILPRNRPKAFVVTDLAPNTKYSVLFEGVNAKDATQRQGKVHTFSNDVSHLRVVALSCDRPERLKPGETNMWQKLSEQIDRGEVDLVLHLGDQVYGQDEFVDAQAILRYSHFVTTKPSTPEETLEVHRLHKKIKERMRDIYRYTWNLPFTQHVLARSSHLMIWSDNDLYNDFTIAKEDDKALEPTMIRLGQEVYREYQRQLWDPTYDPNAAPSSDEFHTHVFGTVGIIVIDMRGNRIDKEGNQHPTNLILNPAQWAEIEKMLSNPHLKTLFVTSEIPFVGDTPEKARANMQKPGLEFLIDHWPANEPELVKLLEAVFDWKHAGKGSRDAVFVAGDIHVGVHSVITDHKTGETAVHLTTSPISNHVCKYFPALEGKVNERFSFSHKPLGLCRNYAYMVADVSGEKGHLDSKLVAGEPTAPHKD